MCRTLLKLTLMILLGLALFAPPPRTGADEPVKKPDSGKKAKPDEGLSAEAKKLIQVHVREFLKQHDTDKDGKLSLKEFYALFDRLDTDSDGALDRKELAEAVKTITKSKDAKDTKEDQKVITFLREHDVNKDGKFSRE